jgi:hypothetical protein
VLVKAAAFAQPTRQTTRVFSFGSFVPYGTDAPAIRSMLPETRPPGDDGLSPGRHMGFAHAKMASA